MYINVPIYGTFFIVMKGVFIMAVNEQIVTGRKFRKLIDEANKLWQRISFWTKASDVEFNDGKNAETKFGAINGVTDSLTSTASNIAASAKAVKTLNDKVTQLSSNLNKMPGGNSGAPIFQSSNNAGWNDWGNSKSLSYTFTKDYSSVMVYVSGGCSGYGMSSSEDQVKTSMYCNLYSGAGTISCTSGTIIKKNSYYIIQNVRSGSTVTMNFSTSGTQEVAIQAVIWEL